ncbi:hypothetical protein SUGI_0039900 [Cryptomeria japonica]|nr:hypothetical protein SUGI_0039900 [Cryptomeria japonica]
MLVTVRCRIKFKAIGFSTSAVASVSEVFLGEIPTLEDEEKLVKNTEANKQQCVNALPKCIVADYNSYRPLLQWCVNSRAIAEGKQLHAHTIVSGFVYLPFISNNLVNMYAKCGIIEDARKMFDKMFPRQPITWTTMVTGYAQNGPEEEALKLFARMQRAAMKLNNYTFPSVLKASAAIRALQEGMQIHSCILKTGYYLDIFTGSALVDMYAKCRVVDDAKKVFDEMPERNVVSWSGLITGCALNGQNEEALILFRQALVDGHVDNMGRRRKPLGSSRSLRFRA